MIIGSKSKLHHDELTGLGLGMTAEYATSLESGLSFNSVIESYCPLKQANVDFPRGVLCGVARTLPTLGATT